MKITFPNINTTYSLHNHSNFSDGANTIEEMCYAAKDAGIKVFGLSDHWVIHPDSNVDVSWAMEPKKLELYIEKLSQLKSILEDDNFSLKIGLEVDFFFENISEVLKELKQYPIDYFIGSVHYAGNFPIDNNIKDWADKTIEDKAEICDIYYTKLTSVAKYKEFAFLGHLDLPKKFNLIDNKEYYSRAIEVLDVVQKYGNAIELNTSGFYKECNEQYPSLDILQAAYQRNIPIFVNADAHDAKHVNRSFLEAKELLKQAQYRV
jgi:histidinol-phosphatase (PHP family)